MDKPTNEQKPNEKVITIDKAKCIGCGLCVTTCHDVFQLGDDGKAHVKDAAACANSNCQEAIDECPAKAISWEEEQEEKKE